MSISISTQAPFLRTSRKFPEEFSLLEKELTNMYLDIAFAVNARIIGNYTNVASLTGSIWNTSSIATGSSTVKISSYRQVYPFGAVNAGATLQIPHGIINLFQFTSISGTCITTFPDYRPLPYASNNANDSYTLLVRGPNILIINGAAGQNIVSGLVVLEWLVQS